MSAIHSRKGEWSLALLLGFAIGIASFFPEALCCEGSPLVILFIPTLPGLLASGLLTGNVHVFPLWLAACVNGVLYFGVGWWLWRLARACLRGRGAKE